MASTGHGCVRAPASPSSRRPPDGRPSRPRDQGLRSAAPDALLALASQLVRARAGACTCFVPHRAQQVGPALDLDIGSAWNHAWQEAVRLAGYDVAPDARLRLRGRSRLVQDGVCAITSPE